MNNVSTFVHASLAKNVAGVFLLTDTDFDCSVISPVSSVCFFFYLPRAVA